MRGSSSKGGGRALKDIKKLVLRGYKIAHIVDGPRGPLGVIKPGLLVIAQVSGMPIVPKPFSRVIIRFSDEVHIPRKLKGDDFEEKRLYIEETLKKLYVETDAIWSSQEEVNRLFNT